MKKFKLIQFFALISLVAFFSSCNKDEENEPVTIESQLVGTWKGDVYYEDGELSDFSDFMKLSSYDFKEDGTGTSTFTGFGSQPLTWSYNTTTEKLTISAELVDLGNNAFMDGFTYVGDITKIDASNFWFSFQDAGKEIEERYVK
jgi:hypothetical protein